MSKTIVFFYFYSLQKLERLLANDWILLRFQPFLQVNTQYKYILKTICLLFLMAFCSIDERVSGLLYFNSNVIIL